MSGERPGRIEHGFPCPHCGEPITMVFDLSVPRVRQIEDCEVCCRPIEVAFAVRGGAIADFEAERA